MCFDNLIKENIYNIIKDNVDERECINLEETFEDIGIGSVDFIKIMVEIEVYYDIEFNEKYYIDEYNNIKKFIDVLSECVSVCKENKN